MNKRKICVVTGTRADYGLLKWLMKEIADSDELVLQIAVSGMHLSPEFGLTYREIESDGFRIDEKVEMLLSSDTPSGITKAIGLGVIGFSDTFAHLEPDIVVLLGDRFEIFAAAQAAMVAKIPIAHIHGGELSYGVMDESIRHAITKMSHLHFVASEPYRRRVIQLGEQPDYVWNVGALGLEAISRIQLLPKEKVEEVVSLHFSNLNFLVTYHPAALANEDPEEAFAELLSALSQFPDAKVIFTSPNADTGGRILKSQIQEFVKEHSDRMIVVDSLGQLLYFSAIRFADVVIGNSSSGLIEVPSFHKATVNIGKRQDGRLRASSVVDCATDRKSIEIAIRHAISPEFQDSLKNVVTPYGSGNASRSIVKHLANVKLDGLVMKRFFDTPFMI